MTLESLKSCVWEKEGGLCIIFLAKNNILLESGVPPGTLAVPLESHAGTHVCSTLGAPFDSHTKTHSYTEKRGGKGRSTRTFYIGNNQLQGDMENGVPMGFVI